MGDHLLYSMVVRSSDKETLIGGSVCAPGNNYDKDAGKIKDKMLQSSLQPYERKRIVTGDRNTWVAECDANRMLYIALFAENYPDRLLYQFLNDLKEKFSALPNITTAKPSEVNNALRQKFEELSRKYNDPSSVDKTAAVSMKIDEATKKTEASLKQALLNQQMTEEVHEKSKNVKNLASNYSENAEELRKIMYWRNVKLKIILGVMGVAALLSVSMPVIEKFASG